MIGKYCRPLLVSLSKEDFYLDLASEVRCLLYLIRHLEEFTPLPPRIEAEIIPLGYLGPPGPYIALCAQEETDLDGDDVPDELELEHAMQEYVDRVGTRKLLELAHAEDLPSITWWEIMSRSSYAHWLDDPNYQKWLNPPQGSTDL